MKRKAIRGSVVAVLAGMLGMGILVLRPAPKVHAGNGGCSVATLQGPYLFTVRADAPAYAHQDGAPTAVAGVRTYDGAGNFSQVATVSLGGQITSRIAAEGTYTLDTDCTGAMTVDGVRNFDLFVAKDGSGGVAIQTDDGTIAAQTLKKQ